MINPPGTIIRLRRELHQHPEPSGQESDTAGRILAFFQSLNPDRTLKNLGGHGLAFIFAGPRPGPTVMLRCELDALPIQETGAPAYHSRIAGMSHACGHDGHMAIIAAVAMTLARSRPARGRAVLLFQPAEENGRGAAAVIQDQRFETIKPDFVFALHNLPGFPLGTIVIRPGTFNCASRGMRVTLLGRTAHAAQPETGRSPAKTMCRIIEAFADMHGPADNADENTFATVVGARLGTDSAFGTAPGQAEIRATLRSAADAGMTQMITDAEDTVKTIAREDDLEWDVTYRDIFPATVNSPGAIEAVCHAAGDRPLAKIDGPFRWSEDFGRFTMLAEGALFGIGAGKANPALHSPDFDFPEALVPQGADVLQNILQQYLY